MLPAPTGCASPLVGVERAEAGGATGATRRRARAACCSSCSSCSWRKTITREPREARVTPQFFDDHSHRIHGAAIYGNMDPIIIAPMLAYIPAPWILWEWSSRLFPMILMNISDIYNSSSTIKIYCDVKKIDLCENHHELTLGTQASANLRKDESSSMFMHSAQRTRLASKRQPSQLPSKNPAHTNPKSSFNIVKHIHSPTIPSNYQLTQKNTYN